MGTGYPKPFSYINGTVVKVVKDSKDNFLLAQIGIYEEAKCITADKKYECMQWWLPSLDWVVDVNENVITYDQDMIEYLRKNVDEIDFFNQTEVDTSITFQNPYEPKKLLNVDLKQAKCVENCVDRIASGVISRLCGWEQDCIRWDVGNDIFVKADGLGYFVEDQSMEKQRFVIHVDDQKIEEYISVKRKIEKFAAKEEVDTQCKCRFNDEEIFELMGTLAITCITFTFASTWLYYSNLFRTNSPSIHEYICDHLNTHNHSQETAAVAIKKDKISPEFETENQDT